MSELTVFWHLFCFQHCGRDSPSGFCFVNNVAVALQHAHQNHEIDRVVIFDIDLHHGK